MSSWDSLAELLRWLADLEKKMKQQKTDGSIEGLSPTCSFPTIGDKGGSCVLSRKEEGWYGW
jgi:hypothetical protein